MWAKIQDDYLASQHLHTKHQLGQIWWTNIVAIIWKHCLTLWFQYSYKHNGETSALCLACQHDKLVTCIKHLYLHQNELLTTDRKWLMDNPSAFLCKACLLSLKSWLHIYKPNVLECLRISKATATKTPLR